MARTVLHSRVDVACLSRIPSLSGQPDHMAGEGGASQAFTCLPLPAPELWFLQSGGEAGSVGGPGAWWGGRGGGWGGRAGRAPAATCSLRKCLSTSWVSGRWTRVAAAPPDYSRAQGFGAFSLVERRELPLLGQCSAWAAVRPGSLTGLPRAGPAQDSVLRSKGARGGGVGSAWVLNVDRTRRGRPPVWEG